MRFTSICGILRDFPGQRPSLVQSLLACFKSWIVMLNLEEAEMKISVQATPCDAPHLILMQGTLEQCLPEYHPLPPHICIRGCQNHFQYKKLWMSLAHPLNPQLELTL